MTKADHCVLDSDRIEAAEVAGDLTAAAYWRAYHAWHTREMTRELDVRLSRAKKARRGVVLGGK